MDRDEKRESQHAVRRRIVWIALDRLPQRWRWPRRIVGGGQLPEMRERARDKIPGIEIVDRSRLAAHTLGRHELRLDRCGDARRDLVLQREDVGQLAVVSLCPDMIAGRRVHKLGGDAHPLSALAHASFEHIAHPEIAPHLLHVRRLALVDERRIASDDEEPAQARQRCDDVLGDPVAEIFLLGIAGHVGEGEDCDRGLVGQRRRRAGRGQRHRVPLHMRRPLWGACTARAPVFANLADEAKPLAGDGADQSLLIAAVADRTSQQR